MNIARKLELWGTLLIIGGLLALGAAAVQESVVLAFCALGALIPGPFVFLAGRFSE